MKHIICTVGGIVGGIVAALFGGWTWGLTALVIMMAIDYISGLVVAGVFHTSPKSPNGGLESRACLKGLIRKVFVLLLVAVAHVIDRVLGITFVRDSAAIAFIFYEVISILENAGLMGIKIPKAFRKAIDILRDKAEETEEQEEKPPDNNTQIKIKAYYDYDQDGSPVTSLFSAAEDSTFTRGVIVLPAEDPEELAGLEPEEVFGIGQGEDA